MLFLHICHRTLLFCSSIHTRFSGLRKKSIELKANNNADGAVAVAVVVLLLSRVNVAGSRRAACHVPRRGPACVTCPLSPDSHCVCS